MVNDTLSDLLTRIRNGCLNNSQVVSIPLTKLSQQICHTLEKEGFIESFQRDSILNDILIIKLKYKDFNLSETSSYNLQAVKGDTLRAEKSQQQKEELKAPISKAKARTEKVKKGKPIDSSIKNSFSTNPFGISEGQTLSKKRPCITNLKRISKPGLRVYARHKQIPTVLGGLGILILSTPKGIMTDREARFRKVGGEILCSIW